ncbi:hypothetical protein HYR99_09705 [Candidatus Poribacteria bacterium]|nr:hypothetical protein [Candidatus Poribacteria bacterium]
MTPIPLDHIRLGWRDHKSALWWLGLLYRRPARFQAALKDFSWRSRFGISLSLCLHALPYLCLWIFALNISLLGILILIAVGIAVGIVQIVFGIAKGTSGGIAQIVFGIAKGITKGIVFGIVFGIAVGIAVGIAKGIVFGIAFGTAKGITGGIAQIVFGIAKGIAKGIALGIVAGIAVLRLYYHPFHLPYIWPQVRGQWYPFHPVAWDDMCAVPFPGLARLLVAYAEQKPQAGEAEIERLITSYPSQRTAALRAKVMLLARKAGKVTDVAQLDDIVAQLPEGKKGFLGQTRDLREWVNEICRLQRRLNTINRPMFREPTAQLLCKEIENFQNRIGGLHEPLASEFRAAANRWLEIAGRQLAEAQAVLSKKPTPQVFRAGDPVNRDSEAFVLRYSVVGELEKQIMLSTGCPGLILYGRRRTGKSTILQNLTGFLPTTVVPVAMSMHNPQASISLEFLVRHIEHSVRSALSGVSQVGDETADLPGLFRFLTDCNARLDAKGERLILALDEYEMIDIKIGEGIFPENLLTTIRESIQTHRRITWMFAGSHEITELPHAGWTSYLVSARTIEVPAFTLAETRLLLTEPLKHSSLWLKDAPERPRFAPEFWGNGGIERIHHEAGGWPHLVQLIAETVIDLLNDEETGQVNADLLECALNQSIVRGHNVLYELTRRESTLPGEWEYLSAFRGRDSQPPPEDEAVRASLRRRLLVETENDEWRLRVPLMARWLRERG